MSKSVQFSLPNTPPSSWKPSTKQVSSAAQPQSGQATQSLRSNKHDQNSATDSVQSKQNDTELSAKPPKSAPCIDQSCSTAAKKPPVKPSIQAETGQLKMETSSLFSPVSNKGKSSAQKKQQLPVNACTIAEKMRLQTNHDALEHTRTAKFELAKMHELLLKVEEEIKFANKGKHTLEITIQDIRRGLSVNQQSISAQQKKRREEDSTAELFQEEAKILSAIKRKLESHLQVIRHQLHSLDNVRKLLQKKVSSLSKVSELNAQSFKIYSGPTNKADVRHYSTSYQQTSKRTEEIHTKEFIHSVAEAIRASKTSRTEIKDLITSAHCSKLEAHDKINTAISQSVEKAKIQQRALCLEKGQLRLHQNSAMHQAHKTEIALGIASGPDSDKYKHVAQSPNRPLMRIRPASALEEIRCFEETKAKLTRQLSASESRRSSVATSDQKLRSVLYESSKLSSFDTQILRVRKMSLDNRWVT